MPTPRQRRKEARPNEIIAAAQALFHSKGFAACKIEDVARDAGVTKGTVYLYFPSKEALFKAVITETVLPNLERIEANIQAHPTAVMQLQATLRLWATLLNDCRGSIAKLIIAEAGNFPELAEYYREAVGGRFRRLVENILEQGIASGEFRACDTTTAVRMLCAPILMANIWRHTFPNHAAAQTDLLELTDSLIQIVMHGIAKQEDIAP